MSAGESLLTAVPKNNGTSLQTMCRQGSDWFRQTPVTLVASAIAIVAFAFPSLTAGLQLDFASVDSGQWWRLLSGHLTHFGGGHLFWDLLMFVVLGTACERQHPKLYAIALITMALGISTTITLTCHGVTSYRGLSGIDTGLFVWFIVNQIRHSFTEQDRMLVSFWIATGTLLIGKLLYESITGEILFVSAEGFTPLVESHLSGAVLGAVVAGLGARSTSPTKPDVSL